MIKAATVAKNGRTTLMIGLSFGNLDKFRTQPLDTFIPIDGTSLGLPIDILLFSGETEGDLERFLNMKIRETAK